MNKALIIFCLCLAVGYGQFNPTPTGSTPGTRTTPEAPEGCNRDECEKLACDEEGMVPKPLGLDEDGCCMTFECVPMPTGTMPTPTGSTPDTRTTPIPSTTLITKESTVDSSSPTIPTTTTTAASSMFTTCIDLKDENGNKCNCGLSGCNACEVQDSEVVCTSCDENRFLRDGRCPRSAACKRGKIEDAPEGQQDCECPAELNNCHICIISKTKEAFCDTCRDGKKLLDGKCVDSCPTGYHLLLKGSSSFGARCEENYRCRKGKISTKDHPRQGEGCTCEGDCYDCDYIFGEGHVCRGCTNEKFLHEGQCVDDCSEVGKVHYGYRTRNRVCIDNLTCKSGKNEEDKSQKCACPPSSGGYKCVRCHFEQGNEAEGARCDKCKIGFLHEGTCVDECPTGFQPNPGSGKRGRFCIPTN